MDGYVWQPQPGPQLAAITADWCEELFFGGAKYGGKSDYLLGDYLQGVEEYGQHWPGILFRRSIPELDEIIQRSHELYPQTGAAWGEQKKTWSWGNGARLKMRSLESQRDAAKFQGHSYCWIGFDELPNWPDLDAYKQAGIANLRYGRADIPNKRIRSTGNPGGPGHHAVKARFIDPAPQGYSVLTCIDTGMRRLFVPSRIQDNREGLLKDPFYINRLKGVGSPELVRALLEGDWNVITGAYFPEFGAQHIVAPFEIPASWPRYMGLDWGFASPFSIGWYAVSTGENPRFPRGALIKYREWYGCSGEPNKGIRLNADQVAKGILEREQPGEAVNIRISGSDAFGTRTGPPISEIFAEHGLIFRRADDGPGSRVAGAQQLRRRLYGQDGIPMLYFFHTCAHTIRTLPTLQHDKSKAEDIDTDNEDHAYDETRYVCMARPWADTPPAKPEHIAGMEAVTLDKLWDQYDKERRKRWRS